MYIREASARAFETLPKLIKFLLSHASTLMKMRLSTLFNVAVAGGPMMTMGMPGPMAPVAGAPDDGYLETVVFKRGDVLSPRELALAETHGVNVTQMFRHSLVRRADGDDITIWVDNSYTESQEGADKPAEAPAVQERAHVWAGNIDWATGPEQCGGLTRQILTADRSAYTGGVHEMYRWAGSRRAGFTVWPRTQDAWHNLVIAGSNNGANARFGVRHLLLHNFNSNRIGTYDIRDTVKASLDNYQRYRGGAWRIAAKGRLWCETHAIIGTSDVIDEWIIGRIDERVPGT